MKNIDKELKKEMVNSQRNSYIKQIAVYIVLFSITVAAGIFLGKYTSNKISVETIAVDSSIDEEYTSDLPGIVDGKININSADEQTLKTINGIGDATAKKIIAYREEHGGFDTVESIMDISGIGQKTYESIKDYICVE